MAELKDIAVSLIAHYPRPEELTRARLVNLVYLIEVEHARRYGHQATNVQWFYDDHGPFTAELEASIRELAREGRVRIHSDVTVFNTLKVWYAWIDPQVTPDLPPTLQTVLDEVVTETAPMSFAMFVKHVYSTAPLEKGTPYQPLDIAKAMKEHRQQVMERIWEQLETHYDRMMKTLAEQ